MDFEELLEIEHEIEDEFGTKHKHRLYVPKSAVPPEATIVGPSPAGTVATPVPTIAPAPAAPSAPTTS